MKVEEVVAAIVGLVILGTFAAVMFGALTGWALMLVLGAILQGYGIAGPGFWLCWALAAVLSLIANSSVSVD